MRPSQNAKRIHQLAKASGRPFDEGQADLVLPVFYAWFHASIFAYHSRTIAKFPNNLQLAVFACLKPSQSH